jgi:hypothetical protein
MWTADRKVHAIVEARSCRVHVLRWGASEGAKATDTAVMICSPYWRTVRVLPPYMRESRDSSMAIGGRQCRYVVQNKGRCR